jgi:hypothetical protein
LGIGRPSTYASIIDTIQARDYVVKKGSALVPTWTAFAVTKLLENHLLALIDYGFTAQMEDDLDAIPEGELLTLPDGAITPGWLTEFFSRRAALIHQQDSNELALELSGDSTLHLMIFRDLDPKEKRRRKETPKEARPWQP